MLLQGLFAQGGFLLRKWRSREPAALRHLPPHSLHSQLTQTIHDPEGFAKALGVEWSASLDCFRLTVTEFPHLEVITKRALVSDVAKTFDVLGWFALVIVKVKILLQRLWEGCVGWDDSVPSTIRETWERWRSELPVLSKKLIPRFYFPKDAHVASVQLHSFCDASGSLMLALYISEWWILTMWYMFPLLLPKSRLKPLAIPRLELCGANLLADLLNHVRGVFDIPCEDVFAWTESPVVLSWLSGSPRCFKVFVGNRVSNILELLPPDCWHHVAGRDNPVDAGFRGMFPSDLLEHKLWWFGPDWLHQAELQLPCQPELREVPVPAEEREISLIVSITMPPSLPILERFSSLTHLTRVTAWLFCFVNNYRKTGGRKLGPLPVDELLHAERYWITVVQQSTFLEEVSCLKKRRQLPSSSRLLSLHPVLDAHGLIRVGRSEHSSLSYSRRHPVILPGSHAVTKLIRTEHLHLLHAGLTLVTAT